MELLDFVELNKNIEAYGKYTFGKNIEDVLNENSMFKEEAIKDLEGFDYTIRRYKEKLGNKPKMGSAIKLPDGQMVYVCEVWDDKVQTTPNGSFKTDVNGNFSYSGGLDSGISKDSLIKTDEIEYLKVWTFRKGIMRANNSIFYEFPVRVFEVKKGSDLSGIPQVEELEKKKYREKADKIKRVNGNGKPYTLPLPEVSIILGNAAVDIDKLNKLTGLDFDKESNSTRQPLRFWQIQNIFDNFDVTFSFHNTVIHKNKLYITFVKSNGEDTFLKKEDVVIPNKQ